MRTFFVALLSAFLSQGVRAETLYFIHVDHLGTPRLAVGEDGVERWRWDNIEPFGDNPPIELMGPEGYWDSPEFPDTFDRCDDDI